LSPCATSCCGPGDGGGRRAGRVQLLAAGGQFFLLVITLFLLYLDQRRATLTVVAVFAASYALLTLLTVGLGRQAYGAGYLAATVVASALGLLILRDRLRHLEYFTFMGRP
jgi:uncharacterized membrane protein